MVFTADLHLHSRYSYACGKDLTLTDMFSWAKLKGIELLSTGDFTHPAWLSELEANLGPTKDGGRVFEEVRFVLGSEISCVYRQNSRTRRVHLLVYAPTFEVVHRIRQELENRSSKLNSDGRPTVAVSAKELIARLLEIDDTCMVVPAHVWTPWYGMLGSNSGFDSLEECFGDMASHVQAVETGLSSDPAMNWGVPAVEGKTIVSFSDAHSLPNMGRELTVFEGKPGYPDLAAGLKGNKVVQTVEFFPEADKYHLTGHRKCGISQTPDQTKTLGNVCPVCRCPLTLGVLHRVKELRSEVEPKGERLRPYVKLMPLMELLGLTMGRGQKTKLVRRAYNRICSELGGEIQILTQAGLDDLKQVCGDDLAYAVIKIRTGQVELVSGFDGQYGTVRPAV